MSQAKQQIGAKEADNVSVQLEFRVEPSGAGCIYIWNGLWNVHIPPGHRDQE